jgi:hypothetical protein
MWVLPNSTTTLVVIFYRDMFNSFLKYRVNNKFNDVLIVCINDDRDFFFNNTQFMKNISDLYDVYDICYLINVFDFRAA